MARQTQKQRSQPKEGGNRSDSNNFVHQALRELENGLKAIENPSPKFLEHSKIVRTGLQAFEKYRRGEISDQELQASVPKRFRSAPPPSWLPAEDAWLLAQYFDGVEHRRKGGGKEVLTWLIKRIATPRGRPPSDSIYSIGKRAALLKKEGLSWMKIALSICRDRGQSHSCSKRCADKIRQAANAFLTS